MIKWEGYFRGRVGVFGNNYNNVNYNNNLNNNGGSGGIVKLLKRAGTLFSKMNCTYEDIYDYENLELAFSKAKRGKRGKLYVLRFEAELDKNLLQLQTELNSQTYKPKPLETFILREPKTRKISKSDFRDRVIHHAICNVIEPLKTILLFQNLTGKVNKALY